MEDNTKRIEMISFVLFFSLGMAGWLNINAVFLMLPLIVQSAPEGYGVASYVVLLLQISNIIALFYGFLQSYKPINSKVSITIILILGICCSFLLSGFWDYTSVVSNHLHSTSLFGISFIGGLVGCLSVVVFYPFTSLYGAKLVAALATGSGSSGLISSILGLIQDPSSPRFSIEWYFRIIGILQVTSFISFILICKFNFPQIPRFTSVNTDDHATLLKDENEEVVFTTQREEKPWFLAFSQAFICSIYYFIVGSYPYATKSFSNASTVLMWMSIGGMASGTIGRLITTIIEKKFGGRKMLGVMSLVLTLLWIYLVITVFEGGKFSNGSSLPIIISYTLFNLLYGYLDTLIFITVGRENVSIEKSTRMIGLANQFGSLIGSTMSFIITLYILEK